MSPPRQITELALVALTVSACNTTKIPVAGQDFISPSLGLMKWIPPGSLSTDGPGGEFLALEVPFANGFWVMEHEVTQGEWEAVTGTKPSHFNNCGANCPVEMISWDDAVSFAKTVSTRDGVPYRLPTSAEWEYAARGGSYREPVRPGEADDVAWYADNSGGTTHAVCGKRRNGYDLCDVRGNVMEWTFDWHDTNSYSAASDPWNSSGGPGRVFRGVAWNCAGTHVRVGANLVYEQLWGSPASTDDDLGVRLAMSE